jgi:hypothetical protein
MRHDELTSLRAELHEAQQRGDLGALARLAGLIHRASPDDPALIEARDALTGAPLHLLDDAHDALARLESAEEDDDTEQTWGVLCGLDTILAAATLLGVAASFRGVTEDAARLIRAFPEPWRPHAEAATALLRDHPPAEGDPAWTLWSTVEASRWELPLDDAGMPAQTRFVLGFWVSLGDWRAQNPVTLAAAEALREAPPWLTLAQGPGWEIALTQDEDGEAVVLCSDPEATASVDGVAFGGTITPVGVRFRAISGAWTVTHRGGTAQFGVDP